MQNVCDTLQKRPKWSDATLHHSELWGANTQCNKTRVGSLFDFQTCKLLDKNSCHNARAPSNTSLFQSASGNGGGLYQCCSRDKKMAAFRK